MVKRKYIITSLLGLTLSPLAFGTVNLVPANAEENIEVIDKNLNEENSIEYTNIADSLQIRGYTVDSNNKFVYGGLTYTKYFDENQNIGVIEEGKNYVTAYTLKDNGNTYTLTAENANGEQIYKEFMSDGTCVDPIGENKNACDWGVGLSGVALSTIYGGAIGMAFGGAAGLIAGAAVGAAWIPVSAACP